MSATTGPLLPGATLGVMGSGQLGRMFALAARPMGYRVITFSPGEHTPTGQVADGEISADYLDTAALDTFAAQVDAVTVEFENIPADALRHLAQHVPVRPGAEVVSMAQSRIREKQGLARLGYPTVNFSIIDRFEDLTPALESLGGPGILKTAGFGYDGKGQRAVEFGDDLAAAWHGIGAQQAVLERRMNFVAELSVVGARGVSGAFSHVGPILNDHHDHILDISTLGAPFDPEIVDEAVTITRNLMADLDAVGVLCVEFFLGADGALVINELAPRPHNSGHLTIEGCIASQFDQQVRTVCGFDPTPTRLTAPVAAMANLLGDLWFDGETMRTPQWAALAHWPEIKLHLYGKGEARRGRKMGHITAVGDDPIRVPQRLRAARAALTRA
ncbi:MAG: 5-(carboxyamino)imidazole ribonucleotide synthase [Bradymonadia bacterium]